MTVEGQMVAATYDKEIANKLVINSTVFENVDQEVIVTTADRVRLCLRDFKEYLAVASGWKLPLSVFGALLPVRLTASFQDFCGISAANWQAFFGVMLIGSLLWFIWAAYIAFQSWKSRSCDFRDVECVVQRLKKGSTFNNTPASALSKVMNVSHSLDRLTE